MILGCLLFDCYSRSAILLVVYYKFVSSARDITVRSCEFGEMETVLLVHQFQVGSYRLKTSSHCTSVKSDISVQCNFRLGSTTELATAVSERIEPISNILLASCSIQTEYVSFPLLVSCSMQTHSISRHISMHSDNVSSHATEQAQNISTQTDSVSVSLVNQSVQTESMASYTKLFNRSM